VVLIHSVLAVHDPGTEHTHGPNGPDGLENGKGLRVCQPCGEIRGRLGRLVFFGDM
jgi:hypothetical protein